MSMEISIATNTKVLVHYHGTMVVPKSRDNKYSQVFKWTIEYSKNIIDNPMPSVNWETTPPYKNKTQGEKRIKELTLGLWRKKYD